MRTEILLTKDCEFANGSPNLAISDTIVGMLFTNQVSLEFYNETESLSSGALVPKRSSLVTTGLSGVVTLSAKPTPYVPYDVQIEKPTIDVSDSCMVQFLGMCQFIEVSGLITGAEYINIVLDRN